MMISSRSMTISGRSVNQPSGIAPVTQAGASSAFGGSTRPGGAVRNRIAYLLRLIT
jgi:hypothetical protein